MVTIIVPTYNEEKNIIRFQENLEQLGGNYEIIFSDGFSSDNTYNLIRFNKIRESKFRSNQMNSAVKYARGDVLWFVHADSYLHPKSVIQIEKQCVDAGCFKLKFDDEGIWYKLLAYGSNYRVLSRNIAFGDQGIFIKKDLFKKIGGYKPIPIMEDYELSMTLKDYNIPFRRINLPIISSSRRYKEKGIWNTTVMMQKLQKAYRVARKVGNINDVITKMHDIYENQKEE